MFEAFHVESFNKYYLEGNFESMKIFVIDFVNGEFVKRALELQEYGDISKVISTYFLHLPVSTVKKKYFTTNCEKECDEVVADLNKRNVSKIKDLEGDNFTVRICKDCGEPFIVTAKQASFYTLKNLDLPARCKTCRNLKKTKTK